MSSTQHLVWRCVVFGTVVVAAAACGSGEGSAPAGNQPGQPGMPAAPQPAQPVAQGQPVPQPAQAAQPVQQAQPGQPAQTPMAGLIGALGAMKGRQQAAGAPAQAIPWQSLVQALPTAAPGWTLDGQPEGESASIGGFTSSQAKCRLKQGDMTAKVGIVDTSLNPMVAMPFNMARTMRVDSSDERMGPINFGTHPGTQKLSKKRNEAQVMVMVNNRILVTVEVDNTAAETPAVGVMQYVNFAHLAQLAGG
jgi:hypothetical protein